MCIFMSENKGNLFAICIQLFALIICKRHWNLKFEKVCCNSVQCLYFLVLIKFKLVLLQEMPGTHSHNLITKFHTYLLMFIHIILALTWNKG